MGLVQARVKLTTGNGKIYVKDSPVLNVNNTPPTGNLGDWDYSDLTLEYRSGYTGRSCSYYFATPEGVSAQVADITVNDPNGVVTISNATNNGNKVIKVASTGKAGIVSFNVPARFSTLFIWDDTGLINGNGYPALKGFRSFGSKFKDIVLSLVSYNFNVPKQIQPNIKTIRFGTGIASCAYFNDPAISDWDVSNLLPVSFDDMFAYCTNFNQDLSGWCVSQVTSPPANFSLNSALTPTNKPVWGTCPMIRYKGVAIYADIAGTIPNPSGDLRDAGGYLITKLRNVPAGTIIEVHGTGHVSPGTYNNCYAEYISGGDITPSRTGRTAVKLNKQYTPLLLTVNEPITTPIKLVLAVVFTTGNATDRGYTSPGIDLKVNGKIIGSAGMTVTNF